jgi:hypothetical protein
MYLYILIRHHLQLQLLAYLLMILQISIQWHSRILSVAPSSHPVNVSSLIPRWIKGGANATLFLHSMSKPRHGTLQLSEDSAWYFYPGKSKEGILLPDLSANCQHLMDTAQLFCGHAKFKNVYDA